LFDVVVNHSQDYLGTNAAWVNQVEPTSVSYTPAGSNNTQIVAAYHDYAAAQYGSGDHNIGWSYSSNGGATFQGPAQSPPVLPDSGNGDFGNAVLARDNQSGIIYLATLSNGIPLQISTSVDNGATFSTPVVVTPNGSVPDKPAIAVDDFQGTGQGNVYLSYVNQADGQIYFKSSTPGGQGWTTGLGTALTSGSGTYLSPEIVVAPDHNVFVFFEEFGVTNPGIYATHLDFGQRWDSPVMVASIATAPPLGFDGIYHSNTFANVAVNPVLSTDTFYIAYTDQSDHGDGLTYYSVYFLTLQYNHSTSQYTTTNSPANVSDPFQSLSGSQWQPSVAVSADGRHLFIGYYGETPDDNDVAQINAFAITNAGDLLMDGVSLNNAIQLTNVDASGNPTGGSFAPPVYGSPDNNPPYFSFGNGFLGDYNNVTADYHNFYFALAETSPATLLDPNTARLVTVPSQADIHLITVPIQFTGEGVIPNAPAIAAFNPSDPGYGNQPTISWNYSPKPLETSAPTISFEYSTPTQGWTPISLSTFAGSGKAALPSSFQFNLDTTYYFRARVQYQEYNNQFDDGVSSPSPVFTVAPRDTVLNGHNITLKLDASGQEIDTVIDGQPLPPVPFSTTGNLLIHGAGGSKDSINLDLGGGSFLRGSTTIDDTSGSEALNIVGRSQNDSISIAPQNVSIGSSMIGMSNVSHITYTDPGGNDTINLSGAIPATLNLASGNSTVTNNDSAPVFVAASTGKTTINATSGTTIIPANSGTGIQQLNFAAINISAGAKVVFATSSATLGDYSHHANRNVAVIDAGGLNIATGGILDMGDNDLILHYLSANETSVRNLVSGLLASGFDGGGFDTAGINSSEASYDANFGSGTRALGWMDNNDIGATTFDGVNTSDLNEVMIKFTYYGDSDLSGTVDATDFGLFAAGKSNAGTEWAFGNYDYNSTTADATDFGLFAAGNSGYKQFGKL